MPPQNQNSEERKGAVKRKACDAMDTNDGASSKQAAEDVVPLVRVAWKEAEVEREGGRGERESTREGEQRKTHLKRFFSLPFFV